MDKDIQEMFKKKNREILINNLKLDIERSSDVLVNSIINIFDKEFDSAIKNINLVYEDSDFNKSGKKVDSLLDSLRMDSYKLIEISINYKMKSLLKYLDTLEFEKEQIEDYYKLIFDTTNNVLDVFKSDDFDKLKMNIISKFYRYTDSKLNGNNSDITNSRINDYITYRLFGKIEDRIKGELIIRDNNLTNKGRESYEKFQDLESRTTII